jgi:hypothetical protein
LLLLLSIAILERVLVCSLIVLVAESALEKELVLILLLDIL